MKVRNICDGHIAFHDGKRSAENFTQDHLVGQPLGLFANRNDEIGNGGAQRLAGGEVLQLPFQLLPGADRQRGARRGLALKTTLKTVYFCPHPDRMAQPGAGLPVMVVGWCHDALI
ncbi:MAG: hypothetical protein EBZ36_17065 [Acidobacteria bacterium]|nr:hypothetical protein [Acidobacteriota bacterium]